MEQIIFSTGIPNRFIDEFMAEANPAFSVIYIYGYRQLAKGNKTLHIGNIADKLNLLASDVLRAWEYWQGKGLVKIVNPSQENFEIVFLNSESVVQEMAQESDKPKGKAAAVKELPDYSVDDVKLSMTRDPEVARLFYVAENLNGKLLTHVEQNMYLGFYDDLGLSVDVIEVLIDYCVAKGHKKSSYMKAVAFDWAENGIETVQQAEEYISFFNNEYRDIMKAFGISGRDPAAAEIPFMNKWLKEYKVPAEIIKAACGKTILQLGKPQFAYADAIIEKWHNESVTTIEQINALEDEFYENIKATKKKNAPKGRVADSLKPKKTRFNNYEGREWDYDKLLQLERDYLDKELQN